MQRMKMFFIFLSCLLSTNQCVKASSGDIVGDSLGEQMFLQINEIMVNPEDGVEWIEIYNNSLDGIDLAGVQIADEVKVRYVFENGLVLDAEDFVVVEFSNVFNNGSETVSLLNFEDEEVDQIAYGHAEDILGEAEKGLSFGRDVIDKTMWGIFEKDLVTKGAENKQIRKEEEEIISEDKENNNPPKAVITLQGEGKTKGEESLSVNVTAEDSSDPDGDDYVCFWDFGDEYLSEKCNPTSHQYKVGEYDLLLFVTDEWGVIDKATKHIQVLPKPEKIVVEKKEEEKEEPVQEIIFQEFDFSLIQISEVYANTKEGDKENEWVELQNIGTESYNLYGWCLDDLLDDGSRPYCFTEETWILPESYLLIYSKDSKLILNNFGDTVNLINPKGDVQESFRYLETRKGMSWARNADEDFLLTTFKTPAKRNIIIPEILEEDSDLDGLTDKVENKTYHTNAQKIDTDGDGMPDGFEIYNGFDPLEKEKNKEIYQEYLTQSNQVDLVKNKTNGELLIVKGKTEPKALVRFFIHSKLYTGVAKADKKGDWSALIETKLESGEHSIETEIVSITGVKSQKVKKYDFNLEKQYRPKQYSNLVKIVDLKIKMKTEGKREEYLVIQNFADKPLNLENWEIVNQEGESFRFTKKWVQPKQKIEIPFQETGLVLFDQDVVLKLINPYGKQVDLFQLQQESEDLDVLKEEKGEEKQIEILQNFETDKEVVTASFFQGKIISDITNEMESFWLKDQNKAEIEIWFDTEEYPFFLAEIYFQKGNIVSLEGVFDAEGKFRMSDFTLIKQAEKSLKGGLQVEQQNLNQFWVYLLILIVLGGFWIVLKQSKVLKMEN